MTEQKEVALDWLGQARLPGQFLAANESMSSVLAPRLLCDAMHTPNTPHTTATPMHLPSCVVVCRAPCPLLRGARVTILRSS